MKLLKKFERKSYWVSAYAGRKLKVFVVHACGFVAVLLYLNHSVPFKIEQNSFNSNRAVPGSCRITEHYELADSAYTDLSSYA
jgi:hypothetical protein